MDEEKQDFDWGDLGRDWWMNAARQLGANERQAKFAAAKRRGCTNTGAAIEAGYAATANQVARSTGYRLARSNSVGRLLAFASAEKEGPDGSVEPAEARRILSGLARGSDPSIRIRACEALARMEAAKASEPQEDPDPTRTIAELVRASPEYGPVLAADLWFAEAGHIDSMPFAELLAPILVKRFPAAWNRYRAAAGSAWSENLDALGAGPVLTHSEIVSRLPTGRAEKKEKAADAT
jgi:hypothetical protein